MNTAMVRVAPRGFSPTPAQQSYADRLMDPGGATLAEIATRVGVSQEALLGWHDDPRFVEWLEVQQERMMRPLVMALWQRIFADAAENVDPKVRMECARLFLARFDRGCAELDREVGKAALAEFGRRLGKAAAPRVLEGVVTRG